MGLIHQDYNLQEYISMVFYCIVGCGVLFHWAHVWYGKPDRIKDLEARMRCLEEGDKIREQKALAGLYPYPDSMSRKDSGCSLYSSAPAAPPPMPPHITPANSLFANIKDGSHSLFHAPPPSQRHRVDSYFGSQCCSDSIAPHEIPITPSVRSVKPYYTSACSPAPPPTPGTPHRRRR